MFRNDSYQSMCKGFRSPELQILNILRIQTPSNPVPGAGSEEGDATGVADAAAQEDYRKAYHDALAAPQAHDRVRRERSLSRPGSGRPRT